MKTIRFLIIGALTLAASVGVVTALMWGQPNAVQAVNANAPSAPLTLPPPYLSDKNVADAPYGPSPVVDGRISPGEYAGAGKVKFPGSGGDVEVFFRQDAITLYVAFDLPALSGGPAATPSFADVYLDTDLDGDSSLDPNDFWLRLGTDGSVQEFVGSPTGWVASGGAPVWQGAVGTGLTGGGWSAEFGIPYSKLGLVPGTFKKLGLALGTEDGGLFLWPAAVGRNNPASWGLLVSSSDWGTFYWKPGPWEDYAPSGMPDFDQMQVGPTYCGPFAAANSLWWFDSKLERRPVGPAGGPPSTIPISDSYTLVKPYGLWDDHDPQNVISLTRDLGSKYFGTDQIVPGTHVYSMYFGIQRYLRDHGLWDDYIVTLVNKPEFPWIAEEVMRSEDVILLLGFWQDQDPGPGYNWVRISGHFVTVAGVDPTKSKIALSDPAQDWAEAGGAGRVLSGTLIAHNLPHTGVYTTHNDAGNVSHDVYAVAPGSPSPGGDWWIPGYEVPTDFLMGPPGMNPNPRWEGPLPMPPFPPFPIHTEIEYALTVSPYDWKASGRWVEDKSVALYGRRFDPYKDFAPSGVPDFDQKQDGWSFPPGPPVPPAQWSFCGPVAAANSLWWFDSKFERHGAVPPTISDTYPLVQAYGLWDDHDPSNVNSLLTPWPPAGWPVSPPIQPGQGELIEDLALYFRTDQPPGVGNGTVITNIYVGLHQYLTNHSLRQGYVITMVNKPEFWWVAEEVERSEDVILLLGFYLSTGGPFADRFGGHYVTVPGVDKQGGFIGFSDPYWDRMEFVLPPNEFGGTPLWTGRVGSDGDPLLGSSGLVPTYTHMITHTGVYTLHNDAANISHDVYRVVTTTSPGGVWGPKGYAAFTSDVANFTGMNGGGISPTMPLRVQTEVEWAVAVSPVADVWVTKYVSPTSVVPGGWLTFTIVFTNMGSTAENVVISDVLPSLINARYTYTLNYTGTLTGYDTYTWTVGTLVPMQGGIITVTAQVDPGLSWPVRKVITNTVEIATTTPEQNQVPEYPNKSAAAFTVLAPDLGLAKVASPGAVVPGDLLTFTIVFSNSGPASAGGVVLTDSLPSTLIGSGWSYWTSNSLAITPRSGITYAWNLPNLAPADWGMVTVTARADPAAGWPASVLVTNVVTITTSSVEGTPGMPNTASATVTVRTADLGITKTVIPTGTLTSGNWLTFTLAYSNTGPAAASGVVITDVLPFQLITATARFTCTASYGGLLTVTYPYYYVWQVGTVPANGRGIITITAQISKAIGSSMLNQALISGWFDRDLSNNRAMASVPLTGSNLYLPVVLKNYP